MRKECLRMLLKEMKGIYIREIRSKKEIFFFFFRLKEKRKG